MLEAPAAAGGRPSGKDPIYFSRTATVNGMAAEYLISDLSPEAIKQVAEAAAAEVMSHLDSANEAKYTKTDLGMAAGAGFVIGAVFTAASARFMGFFNRPVTTAPVEAVVMPKK